MILAVATATIVSFVWSAALYAAPPVAAYVGRHSTPRPGLPTVVQMGAVVARSLVAACLIAGLMQAAGWDGVGAGALLGLALGVLPTAILTGAVVHEGTPVALAAIHALDWVVKLAVIGALVGLLA
ncbi:DUF1761 family protein [Glycomyces harbinensis]|uniref:DUF1761 domain-containing protein n=1 Tax=Glycomyces harbinensis TaxID=58114 RepID=A0A1G7APK2_9ACTN|nr:DUF1761 family protein [Glycomyces harbinensis]SDE15806.1 Protein of unknown function [Glycomyces harbinensis]